MTDPGVLAKRKLVRLRQRLVAAAETTRNASSRTRLDAPSTAWAAVAESAAVLDRVDSSTSGLDEDEVARRLQVFGFNRVAHEEVPGWWTQLRHSVRNPFVILLAIIAAVSLSTGDHPAAIIIAAMVTLSVALRFFQERRSVVAASKLRALVRVTATVLRRDASGASVEREVAIDSLVPGDIVRLAAGDMVPADARLVYLQHAVEQITGRPLNEVVHELVFVPLKMKDSSFLWRPAHRHRSSRFCLAQIRSV